MAFLQKFSAYSPRWDFEMMHAWQRLATMEPVTPLPNGNMGCQVSKGGNQN